MRHAKAPIAIALAALLILGGTIAALAFDGSSKPEVRGAPQAVQSAHLIAAAAPAPSGTACAAQTAAVVAKVDGEVAERIYSAELRSSAVTAGRQQIAGNGPLISAMRSGSRAAVQTAVHALVYSGTHIVRLRVSRGSRLLADVGGPYIIAPVTGTLRDRGRAIGRFSFSVQDDLGYIKLVTRFIAVPLVLRTPKGQVPVEGQAAGAPARIPARGPVSYHGATFEAYSFTAQAFPKGTLRVSLLSPPRSGLSRLSCAQVRADESARIATHVARRFSLGPTTLPTYAGLVSKLTLARVIIKAGGRTYMAGGGSAPRRLPSSGTVTLGGKRYAVATVQLPTSVGTARASVLLPG